MGQNEPIYLDFAKLLVQNGPVKKFIRSIWTDFAKLLQKCENQMPSGEAINHQAVLEAIPGSHGIILHIAQKTGHCWQAVRGAIDNNPILKAAWDAECESRLDKTEKILFKKIDQDEDVGLIKWHLATKGKTRGFGDSLNISGEIQVLEVQPVTKTKDAGIGSDSED